MAQSSGHLVVLGVLFNITRAHPMDSKLGNLSLAPSWGGQQSCNNSELGEQLRCILGIFIGDERNTG